MQICYVNKVLLIIVFWITLDIATPLSFADEISGTVEQVIQAEVKKLENPNPTLPPEKNCGNCSESRQIKTEVKSSPTPTPSPSPSTSPSPAHPGADVKGIEATPKPTVRAVIKPSVKPIISPSPLSSPSASISASPSTQPTSEPAEEKETSTIIKIWNWILELFKK